MGVLKRTQNQATKSFRFGWVKKRTQVGDGWIEGLEDSPIGPGVHPQLPCRPWITIPKNVPPAVGAKGASQKQRVVGPTTSESL
jgi:hypothetical protein